MHSNLYFIRRCSAAFKCCWMNSCNRSCVMAENLNRVSMITLPSIPINVSAISVEQESRRKAKIIWLMRIPDNHYYDRIEYILEARSHIGHSFSKYKLSEWFVLQAENILIESMHSHIAKYAQAHTYTSVSSLLTFCCSMTKAFKNKWEATRNITNYTLFILLNPIKCRPESQRLETIVNDTLVCFSALNANYLWRIYINIFSLRLSCWVPLQIGRFYEFRIAALNENGTRGYSETTVFQLNESKYFYLHLLFTSIYAAII